MDNDKSEKINKISLPIIILGISQLIMFFILTSYMWEGDFYDILALLIITSPLIVITFIPLLKLKLALKKIEKQEISEIKLAKNMWIFAAFFFLLSVLFLVLLIFGLFSGFHSIRDPCISTAGIDCVNYEVDVTNNKISITLTNNMGREITIKSVDIITLTNMTSEIVIGTCQDSQILDANSGEKITVENPVGKEELVIFSNCTLTTENTPLENKNPGDRVSIIFNFEYLAIGEGEVPHLGAGSIHGQAGNNTEFKKIKILHTIKTLVKHASIILPLVFIYIFLFRKIINTKYKEDKQK